MRVLVLSTFLAIIHLQSVHTAAIETDNSRTSLHFDFKTENGQHRVEDIKYENAPQSEHADEVTVKPVEYRGGYSFISADGYEYTVKYKANKNGFQPYVTAHKLMNPPKIA